MADLFSFYEDLETLPACSACGLNKKNQVGFSGKGDILVLLESPTMAEIEFGDVNNPVLTLLNRDNIQYIVGYGASCPCDGEVSKHIECCFPLVQSEIKRIKPKVVIAVGKTVVPLLQTKWKASIGGLSRWSGCQIPMDGYWLCPIESMENNVVLERDVFKAMNKVDEVFDFHHEDHIKIIKSEQKAVSLLKVVIAKEPELMAFDYETSGLKPYNEGHFIQSLGICCGINAFSFLLYDECLPYWKKILTNPRIGKIAANMKHEMKWTKRILGYDVVNWQWDTMLMAHYLDPNPNITSLDFQAFINFGVAGYGAGMKKYWGKDGNEINRIKECPVDELLTYNATDALMEYRLAILQMKKK